MEPTIKYPKTDAGRKAYIKDSLSYKDIKDESFQFKQVKKDKTLEWMNIIIGGVLALMLSPLLIICLVYLVFSWLFTLRHPISREGKRLRAIKTYLHGKCNIFKTERTIVIILTIAGLLSLSVGLILELQ